MKDKSVLTPESEESNEEGQDLGSEEENFPFIVLEINLNRAIIPLYKTPSDVKETVQDYIPPREIPRRKLVNAGMAQQRFRRAVLEAAAEVSAEYSVSFNLFRTDLYINFISSDKINVHYFRITTGKM